MLWIIRHLADRLKALLLADAALDLEAEFAARRVDREAELLRKAQEFEHAGLESLAQKLRRQTESLSSEHSPASVLRECELSPETDTGQRPHRLPGGKTGGSANGTAKTKTARKSARR